MIFQVQYDTMTRAHLSFLTAWGPLPTCVVAPLTPLNLRAADSASDDGLVLPLRNGKLASLFCTHEDWNTRDHPGHPFVHDGERSWMPNEWRVSGSRRAEGDERVRCTRVLASLQRFALIPSR